MALGISVSKIASLINTYMASPRDFFSAETRFADPHDLAAVIKWGLARLGRVYPVPVPSAEHTGGPRRAGGDGAHDDTVLVHQRGFLESDVYQTWAAQERQAGYPKEAFSAFLDGLPSSSAALLVAVLSLLSSTTSYSLKNGMTPSRLARLLGPLIFGLPEDENFDKTYDVYVRASNATEHLLLAYIRDTGTTEALPTRLADHVRGYPNMLSEDASRFAPDVRSMPITVISRTVRLYSTDLVRTACELRLAEHSREWAACCSGNAAESSNSGRSSISGTADTSHLPQLSERYRKLINLRGSNAATQDSVPGSADEDLESYTSLADKAWGDFMADGFSAPDQSKLLFDLNESERKGRFKGRQSLGWNTFEQSGFATGDDSLNTALAFDTALQEDVRKFPEERAELMQKLHKTNKKIPSFTYDTEPRVVASPSLQGTPSGQWHEKPYSRVDDVFPEVYADYLLCNGWSNRDELTHRNANFVIVQYKSRPTPSTVDAPGIPAVSSRGPISSHAGDDRTDAAWFVIEEVVPSQYRSELEAAGRKKNRGRAGLRKLNLFRRRKEKETGKANHNGGGANGPSASDAFFDEVFKPGLGTVTKKLTIDNAAVSVSDLPRASSQASTVRESTKPQEDSAPTTSSSRLLTSLKARASKRLRSKTSGAGDEYVLGGGDDNGPPPPPPKEPPGFSSFSSDEIDAHSLQDPEIEALSRPDQRKAPGLFSMGRAGKGQSQDNNVWVDVMHKKDKAQSPSGDIAGDQYGSPPRSRNATMQERAPHPDSQGLSSLSIPESTERTAAASPPRTNDTATFAASPILMASWARENTSAAPASAQHRTPPQKREDAPHITTPTGSSSATPSPPTRRSRPAVASPSPHLGAVGPPANDSSPAAALSKPNYAEPSPNAKLAADRKESEEGGEISPHPLHLDVRNASLRSNSTDSSDREKAREVRINAAKKRAQELRANLTPVGVNEAAARLAERRGGSDDGNLASGASNTATSSSPSSTLSGLPSKPKDDPFSKDRISGRVASITSKFGGVNPKPITPQSTGNSTLSSVTNTVASPSGPAPSPQRRTVGGTERTASGSSSAADATKDPQHVKAGKAVPEPIEVLKGPPTPVAKDAKQTPRTPLSPSADANESNTRRSFDSSVAGVDTETIYPEDAASNFSPDTVDEDPLNSNGRPTSGGLPSGALFSNMDQSPAVAGAAAAAALAQASSRSNAQGTHGSAAGTSSTAAPAAADKDRAEDEDHATEMAGTSAFTMRYQPGMPLSNVEEERESVLSGSNV